MKLIVKRINEGATLPTVAHPGEDIGYDLYALEDTYLVPGEVTKVRTGIAVAGSCGPTIHDWVPCGFIIKDRSSMAVKGIFTHGGVIDAGYRGEVIVLMSVLGKSEINPTLKAGTKIAQMIPAPVLTGRIVLADALSESGRSERGFGSSGA